MFTVEETMDEIHNLGGWGHFVTEWHVENRRAIVWMELIEDKRDSDPWKPCYVVRYWENDECKDTRYFPDEIRAEQFARDYVNAWHRLPHPTD